jgi:DNA polymerase III sliding clamp (beta) subunit (PCNA family)
MIIKTKDFKDAANKILLAADLDTSAANLELTARNSSLYLNVTNKEYYVSVKFPLETDETFRAVVDASLFLSLISGFTTDTFGLDIKDNTVVLSSGKSKYKVAMIYENENLMTLPVIAIQNKTVEMNISNDILMSILNVNSKELLKTKYLDVSELNKLYYIDETGCFTFTNGSCLNSFTLEKPVKLLLNDRIVRLFKLFKDDVMFSLGQDPLANGNIQTKMVMETSDTYLAAVITCDDTLIAKVQHPCEATKRYLTENYDHKLVLSTADLSAAINRLMAFTKNSKATSEKVNMAYLPTAINIENGELVIKDKFENYETVSIANESYSTGDYEMFVNLFDLKLVLDSCKTDHITVNCGNHRSIVVTRGTVANLIPEVRKM